MCLLYASKSEFNCQQKISIEKTSFQGKSSKITLWVEKIIGRGIPHEHGSIGKHELLGKFD
jgi:hypothetical protein